MSEAAVPIRDSAFLHADAVYDVVSVSRGSFFRLQQHQDRFAKACEIIQVRNPFSRDQENTILHRLVALTGFRDAYVWWAVTRGQTPPRSRDYVNPEKFKNRFYAFAVPYVFLCDDEQRSRGIDLVVSERYIRIPPRAVDPHAKNFHWLDFMMSLFEAGQRGAEWSVLTDEAGYVVEAPGSNVFALKDGTIFTPESGCLEGITRQTALELCRELAVPCKVTKVHAEQLRQADEAFLTSTAGGIMPINRVDGELLGGQDGPGELTTRLHNLYWEKRWAGWDTTPVRYKLAG